MLNSFNDLVNSMNVHLYHNYIEETDSKDNLVVIRFTQQCNTEIQWFIMIWYIQWFN